MRIDPAIQALQRDPALQRQAQAAMIGACQQWRADAATARLIEELEVFGAGAALSQCPALEACFIGEGPGQDLPDRELLGGLLDRMCAVLAGEPFAQPPFRHASDGEVSSLLIARSGRAQLVLHACEPGQWSMDSASFSDAERFEVVLAGSGSAQILRRAIPPGDRPLDVEDIALSAGTRLALALAEQALHITRVDRRLVCLRLHRFAADPAPTRCHALDDGRLLRQSSGDMASSRQEMMLAILGRMKRADAVPDMAAMALERGGDALRWQALRECLALDSGAGFTALCTVASRADDPLCASAGALRAQLVELYPELLQLENNPCPA